MRVTVSKPGKKMFSESEQGSKRAGKPQPSKPGDRKTIMPVPSKPGRGKIGRPVPPKKRG